MTRIVFGQHNSTVFACCLISAVLGSIHAFSVFIPEWQILAEGSRAKVNTIYSLALACLTLSVLMGYKLFVRFSPTVILLLVALGAGSGLWFAATFNSIPLLHLFYGCLFGTANGLGYGYVLQLSGQVASRYHTLAMSLTTASYAMGATVAPPLLIMLIEFGENSLALKASSLFITFTIVAGAMIIKHKNVSFDISESQNDYEFDLQQRLNRRRLWLAYGCAVSAGLMVISHAYTLAEWYGNTGNRLTLLPVLLGFGNLLGGCIAGYVAIRTGTRLLICWLPVLSGVALTLLLVVALLPTGVSYDGDSLNFVAVLLALIWIGFAYGAIIALYPVLVFDLYGKAVSTRVYGQIFTAWGIAGLFAPTVTGVLFDLSNSYAPALAGAIALSLISTIVFKRLPEQEAVQE